MAISLYAGLAGLAASPIRQLTATSGANMRPAWSPDSRSIAFQRTDADDRSHIYVMDADGGNVRAATAGDADDRHPAWSPDGKLLAVDSGTSTEREIWIIDVASTHRTQVTRLGAVASFPSWSPDGMRIAFYLYRAGASDLWIVGRDGTGVQQVTQGLATEQAQQCTFACHSAAWSPRGDQLAFSSGDQSHVMVMAPVARSTAKAVSPDDEHAHFPLYLADGRLVYVSEHITLEQSWTDLWAVPPDDPSARTQVAGNVQAQGPFELSGDGRALLFASPRSGNFEIYAVTLDEAGKAALAQVAGRDSEGATASVTSGAAAAARPRTWPGPFGDSTPYVLGLAAIGLVGLGIELLVRARRMGP
jgi:Tol biopolymer transport system component